MQVCGKTLQKCIFRVTQSARQSHSGSSSLCASNAHDDREKESKNFKNEDDLFHSQKKEVLFWFWSKNPLFRRCWSVFLSHRSKKKKKKLSERERDVAAEKRERFSCFSLKRHTYKNHASSSHITTGVLSSLCDSTTLFSATLLFVSERYSDKRNNVVVSFLFLLFETRFTRVRSSIVHTISIFIQRTTKSGERFFL